MYSDYWNLTKSAFDNVPDSSMYVDCHVSMEDVIAEIKIITGISKTNNELPTSFSLSQNYPNPFNPSTRIRYELPVSSKVKIMIYDILGREITTLINETRPAGRYEIKWNASRFSSGVYFYRIQAGNFVQTKKLMLLK